MRILLFLALPLMAASQTPPAPNPAGAGPQKPPEKCSIEGQVNATTGEPVRQANLVLRRADPQPGMTMQESYSTATGPDGKFAMAELEPGRYRLSVNRTGFVSADYGSRGPGRAGAILALAPGQHAKDINFRLTPHAVISGRVLDENGDPVAYVQVRVLRYRYAQGRKQLAPAGGSATNDLGEYRIFGLPPGRVYLSATASMTMDISLDRSANPAPEEGYVPVYYPNTTDPAAAAPLELAAGAQMRGIDFTLSKARTVRIRGRVVNATGLSGRGLQLMITPRDGLSFMGMNRAIARDQEGHFEFRGVAPGSYLVTAMLYDAGKAYSVRQPVEVGNTNVENLVLTLGKGIEVHGSVRIDGGDAPANLGNLRVMLQQREAVASYGPVPNTRVQDDGTFTLTEVNPDSYVVSYFSLPEGYYVKAIRMGNVDVKEEGLDLRSGAAGPLELVLSPKAATIDGVVRGEDQNPASGVTVVLVPPAKLRDRTEFYKNTTTDQYGRFTLKNIEPGDYTVFAWEDVEPGAYLDPEFLKPVESSGKALSVQEGGHESVDLQVIPAADENKPKPPAQTER